MRNKERMHGGTVLAMAEAARGGDEEARSELALYVYNEFMWRLVDRLSKPDVDPAVCMEDLKSTFFEGILKAIDKVDHRGNPAYFIAQCGIWLVLSELKAVQKLADHRGSLPSQEGVDPWQQVVDHGSDSAYDRVLDKIAAEQVAERVVMRVECDLGPRHQEAVGLILEHSLDPGEIGFNKRLAELAGVSPQRMSQVLEDVRGIM
jgi:hypothetical protein